MGRESGLLVTVQESEVWPYEQEVNAQPHSILGNETHNILKDFEIQTDHLITTRRADLELVNKNKKTSYIVNFIFPADHRIKSKSVENDRNLDLARELKKLWNMKMTVTPIVIGALGTIPEILVQQLGDLEIRGQIATIQGIAFLKSARILRRVLEIWGDSLSLKLQWKTIR